MTVHQRLKHRFPYKYDVSSKEIYDPRGLRKRRVGNIYIIPSRAPGKQCEICGKIFSKTPHMDHDHNTNQFRGWLCGNCNTGLGMFADNIDILINAIDYLNRTRNVT